VLQQTFTLTGQELVSIADRTGLAFEGHRGEMQVIHLVIPLDADSDLWAVYSTSHAAAEVLRAALAPIHARRDHFAQARRSERYRDGAVVLWPILIPAHFEIIDEHGGRIALPPGRGLIEADVGGALLALDPKQRGILTAGALWLHGPIELVVDQHVRAQAALTLKDSRMVRLRASAEPAARIEFASVAGRRRQRHIHYLIRDELERNWFIAYQFDETIAAHWIAQLAAFER
jgi:hypothetical protein